MNEISGQVPPNNDNRYRVSRSVQCYAAELICGTMFCTWYFQASIERSVYVGAGGAEFIVYKNKYYRLQSPANMLRIVKGHLADRGAVNIAGLEISHEYSENEFTPFHFIDVTSNDDRESYQHLRPKWLEN